MKLIFVSVFLLYSLASAAQTSVYDIKIKSVDGGTFNFEYFKDRQVFIVNIATESEFKSQLDELQQLHERFSDSGLVIIAVPSNDFGKETRNDAELKNLYNKYSFLIASKTKVKGDDASEIFSWLNSKSKNGVADDSVKADFKKYLIDRSGKLVASFNHNVSPMHPVVLDAIRSNQN